MPIVAQHHYHLMGVSGTGMSTLAELLHGAGATVSGCDLRAGEAADHLRRLGIRVSVGHHPDHLEGVDALVVSSAIGADNPERAAADSRGIPVRHRAEVLASVVNGRRLIAVAGAHGKTTVTAMITRVLADLGLDPLAAVGFAVGGSATGARVGRGDWAVVEADESDGSFLRFAPDVAVVTTVEPDHLENYGGSFERLVEAYRLFLAQTRHGGTWVVGMDSPTLRRLVEQGPAGDGQAERAAAATPITYALDHPALWQADQIELLGRGSAFVAVRDGRPQLRVQLAVPGRHMVANALAALAVADRLGLDLAAASSSLAGFTGARRRFEVLADVEGCMVVDDYAHHPTEIAAVISAAKDGYPGRDVVALFQPHRYHRTAVLMDEFAGAFDRADGVILGDVYAPPPEQPIEGVSGRRLYDRLLERDAWRGRRSRAAFCPTLEEMATCALRWRRPGTILLVMGAGSITQVAHRLAADLKASTGAKG